MAGYYDPNKDYSLAIEQAKAAGQDTKQLEQERANKIADKYGGNEPAMYGSDKTYNQLTGSNGNWQNQETVRNAVNTALQPSRNNVMQQMDAAAQAGEWDTVGYLSNQLLTPDGYYGGYNAGFANDYFKQLADTYNYDSDAYYNEQYDKAYGAGSAAAFDATGGAIKTYAQLVEAIGASKAQELVAQYGANVSATPSQSTVVPGLSLVAGMATSGGANNMTKYLEEMYKANLEAELSALKSAYDSNVAELESQNDRIAEEYRAARNQAAAQNALQMQGMNERALATGLNTGASGQLALAQNMAYQGNLGNLWAKEAQDKAESDRMMAEMMRDYNASVNQATATINAQKTQAIYNELIRQQELAAAAEAARIKQEQADREWAYMLEQDALDRQLAYAQLAAKNTAPVEEKPRLTYAQMMEAIESGNVTPSVLSSYEYYRGAPYGYQPPADTSLDGIARAAAQYRQQNPAVTLDSRTLDGWLANNGYQGENAQLFKAYLEEYGARYSRQ